MYYILYTRNISLHDPKSIHMYISSGYKHYMLVYVCSVPPDEATYVKYVLFRQSNLSLISYFLNNTHILIYLSYLYDISHRYISCC